MTEIPDPPRQRDCAACGPLTWLWSPRRQTWVAFVPARAGGEHAITPHPCAEPRTVPGWRASRQPSRPTAEYLAVKAALGRSTETETHRD